MTTQQIGFRIPKGVQQGEDSLAWLKRAIELGEWSCGQGENSGMSSGLPKRLAVWAPTRACSKPLSERSVVLVMPTRPSLFQTRTVMGSAAMP